MPLTLTFVVLLSAIVILFSQEIGNFIKKAFTYSSIKLLVPLALASFFIILYEQEFIWVFFKLQIGLLTGLSYLVKLTPTWPKLMKKVILILCLMIFALIPILIGYLWQRKKPHLRLEKTRITAATYTWLVALFLFLA